jgi:hypothetical protein
MVVSLFVMPSCNPVLPGPGPVINASNDPPRSHVSSAVLFAGVVGATLSAARLSPLFMSLPRLRPLGAPVVRGTV